MTKIRAKITNNEHSRVFFGEDYIFRAQMTFFSSADLLLTHFEGQVTTHNALQRCLPGQRGGDLDLQKPKCKILMRLFLRIYQVMF